MIEYNRKKNWLYKLSSLVDRLPATRTEVQPEEVDNKFWSSYINRTLYSSCLRAAAKWTLLMKSGRAVQETTER